MKKTLKITSIIVFIFWTLLLIFGLSFGTGVAKQIINGLKDIYKYQFNNYVIYDVSIANLQETYYPGSKNKAKLEFEITSNHDGKDYELRFNSLDKEVFWIDALGNITGYQFSGETQVGRLQITSNIDKKFKKIIELKFTNIIPDDINTYVSDYYSSVIDSKTKVAMLKVGIPIYVSAGFPKDSVHTSPKIIYELDEEYFEKVSANKYIPIKPCEETKILYIVGNLRKEVVAKIEDVGYDDHVDIIKFTTTSEKIQKGSYFTLKMQVYKDPTLEGDALISSKNLRKANVKYDIFVDNKEVLTLGSNDRITAKAPGTANVIVHVLDKDNNIIKKYKQTIVVGYTEEELIELVPNMDGIKDKYYSYESENKLEEVNFPKKTTLIYDKEKIKVTIDSTGKVLRIYGTTPGEYKIKAVIDNATGYYEKEFVVVIEKDSAVRIYKNLVKNVGQFVSKIMGHFSLFVVEGIVALWFILNNKNKKSWINILIYASIGLGIAAFTEILQLPIFLQGRNASIKDVILDFSGYVVGGLIAAGIIQLIVVIVKHIRSHNSIKQKE